MLGGATGTQSLSSAEVFLTGAGAGDETGINVSGIDDIDGDGFNELLIGSAKSSAEQGTVHFVYGKTFR